MLDKSNSICYDTNTNKQSVAADDYERDIVQDIKAQFAWAAMTAINNSNN